MNKKTRYKIFLIFIIFAIGLTLSIALLRFTYLPIDETRIIDASNLRATAEIDQTSTPFKNTVGFLLQTNKTCYGVNEPIHSWVNVANLSEHSIRVLKTLRFFTGNEFQEVIPLVNGVFSKAQVLAIDEKKGNRADDYAMLLPYESVTTYIPNFLELVDPEVSDVGHYRLSLKYENYLQAALKQIVIVSNSVKYELLIDEPVWTGTLISNEVNITIVDNSIKCNTYLESDDIVTYPEITRSWSR